MIISISCLTSPTAALPGLLEQVLMHDVQQYEQKHHYSVGERSDSKEIELDTVMILFLCPDTHSS